MEFLPALARPVTGLGVARQIELVRSATVPAYRVNELGS